MTVQELPESVRRETAHHHHWWRHVFQTPSQRVLIINSQVLHGGDKISPELEPGADQAQVSRIPVPQLPLCGELLRRTGPIRHSTHEKLASMSSAARDTAPRSPAISALASAYATAVGRAHPAGHGQGGCQAAAVQSQLGLAAQPQA